MAAITVQDVGADGLADVTFSNSSASDTVTPGVRVGGYELAPVFVIISNGDDSPHNVAIGDADPVEVANGDTAVFPIYSEGIGDGSVTITSDDPTSQTIAAIRLVGALGS